MDYPNLPPTLLYGHRKHGCTTTSTTRVMQGPIFDTLVLLEGLCHRQFNFQLMRWVLFLQQADNIESSPNGAGQ